MCARSQRALLVWWPTSVELGCSPLFMNLMKECVLVAGAIGGACYRPPAVRFGLLVLAAFLAWTHPAFAHPVEYFSNEGCVSEQEFRGAVDLLRNPEREVAPARVTVSREHESWVAVIEAAGAATLRTVEGESCNAVVEAAALIVALGGASEPREPAPKKPIALPPPHRERVVWGAGIAIGADSSWLPEATALGQLSVSGSYRGFRVQLFGEALLPRDGRVPERPDRGAEMNVVRAGLRPCYLFTSGPWALGPCAHFGGAYTRAQGFGTKANRTADTWIPDAGGGVDVLYSVTAIMRVRAFVDVRKPFATPTFFIEDAGTVHRLPTWTLVAGWGGEFSP